MSNYQIIELQRHNVVHKLANLYFDDDASSLLGVAWEQIVNVTKRTLFAVALIAVAMYFWEHSKWHLSQSVKKET